MTKNRIIQREGSLSSISVIIRLHTKNQITRLSESGYKVFVGGVGLWVPLNYVITQTLYWVKVGL